MASTAENQGEFTTVCQLASGGMGKVEIAVRQKGRFERLYAVKRLHASLRYDERYRTMFMDEGRVAGLLRHVNVVSVLDVGEDVRGPFLVMDYIEGLSLGDVLEHHHRSDELLPVQLCLEVMSQVAEGLHAAHELRDARGKSLNLIHRDLTPQNILLGFDGVVRVTDFGVAKSRDRATKTETGVLKGKFGYMSPEQLRFESLDRRSDLFSLGVLLYELLSGRRLYGKGDNNEAARRILNEPPPDLDDARRDAPVALTALIFELLAKDRELRPRTARKVAQRLEELLIDVRARDGSAGLAQYMESVHADARSARKRKIETGLRILDRRREEHSEAPTAVTSRPPAVTSRPARARTSSAAPRSRPSTPAISPRYLFEAPGNLLMRHANFFLQIRDGAMTEGVLDAFERELGRLGSRYPRAAYLAIIEPGAEIPNSRIRKRQKQMIVDNLLHVEARLAATIRGDTVVAKLTRTVTRMLTPERGEVKITSTVAEAMAWLAPYIEEQARGTANEAVATAVARAKELSAG